MTGSGSTAAHRAVAIVGMAGRFPGAADVDELWSMLLRGTEAVRRFSAGELRSAGVPEDLIADPDYRPFAADLPGIEDFDAEFFGITPAEARLADPQQRIFLECVWAALEDAGTPPTAGGGRIGVFGSASLSSYLLHHVLRSTRYRGQAFTYPVLLGNDKDYLATNVSYRLNLHGPSVTVQTACSSSLVALDLACSGLRSGRCDVAVAGGVSIFTPQTVGYLHQQGGTYSRDGHCRPFDASASGMVRGSGCGVVVLKRLEDALADRDHLYAVVAGTAVNNDGSTKAGYTAPSPLGQAEVIRACLDASGVAASAVGFVEAHGTGTYLGDPIEIAALHGAYAGTGDPPLACALGSIKANIGHLDAAAGMAGLIKTALVLRHQTVPPQINFAEPNPELRLLDTPFTVHTRAYRPDEPIRAAAVTSLGIGGTNAHCVLTAPPPPEPRPAASAGGEYVLLLSAPDEARLGESAADLVAYLEGHPGTRLDDLAYTLAAGRRPLPHRAAVTASTPREAVTALRELRDGRLPAIGDPGPDATRVGDVRQARKIRLPGVRLRRVRHWIEAEAADHGPAKTRDEGGADRDGDDLIAATAEVFRTHLGIDSVRPDDDYFQLGGDSLHAIEVVGALRRRLGAPLTPERFAELKTPRRVAHWCRAAGSGGDGDPGIVRIKDGAPGRAVFLIHPSGGTVSFARALAGHSTDPGAMYAIPYPLELSDSLTTIPRMAEHYAGLIRGVRPHGPYRIGGYSLGGTIALEIAHLLTGLGQQVERVLLFDTPAPEEHPDAPPDEDFFGVFPSLLRLVLGLPDLGTRGPDGAPPRTFDEAIRSVRRPDWTQATVRELRNISTAWRVGTRALAGYRPRPYPGRVDLFAAEHPAPVDHPSLAPGTATAAGWRRFLTGDLRVTCVPGHHFSIFAADNVPALAAAYDRALSGTHRRRPRRPVALLFPGQGIQHAGMGGDLLTRYPALAKEADQVLGYSIAAVCAGDPGRDLADTAHAQPAIYVVNALAARQFLDETGQVPALAMGHSVGEYNALELAGVFSFADGLRLVAERGAAMARIKGGGMIAVTGLPDDELHALLETPDFARLDLAASNAPRHHTLAGMDPELERLTPVLLARGARAVRRLNVSGPFHSRFMRAAAEEFRAILEKENVRLAPPAVPVIANTTALPHVPGDIPGELVAQIDHPVLWRASIETAMADHDPEFHEIGNQRILTPMLAQIQGAPGLTSS